jgi:hypothetical protein
MKSNPLPSSAAITYRDEWSLGTLESQPTDLGSFDLGDRIGGRVLEIELECLAEICEGIVLAVAEAGHVDIEALSHIALAFMEDNSLDVDRLHQQTGYASEFEMSGKARPEISRKAGERDSLHRPGMIGHSGI